jgi:lipid-binding SYLF domain-containing protein
MTWFRENEKNAKGILIIPELTMGGFIFGGTVEEQVRKSKNRCNPFF